MSNWIAILFTILTMLSIMLVLIGKGRLHQSARIMCSVRPVMFLTNLPFQFLTVLIGVLLSSLPILNWSWWSLLSSKEPRNITYVAFQFAWFAPFFGLLLIVAMPLVVETEEEFFRLGTPNWRSGIARSVIFGLAHMTVGAPLGFALALSIPGLWFTQQYFKGNVKRSMAYHTAWNLVVFSVLLLAWAIPTFL